MSCPPAVAPGARGCRSRGPARTGLARARDRRNPRRVPPAPSYFAYRTPQHFCCTTQVLHISFISRKDSMRAYPGSSDARINPTHTLGERLLAQLKTIDRPPVRHVLGAVSSSASRSLTQRALARRCASGSSIAWSSPSHPRQRHPPRPPRSPSAPNRSTRARSIRHDHRRDDVPPADRERSRGPINLLRGSIPTSQHTANSPQGLKDGKA